MLDQDELASTTTRTNAAGNMASNQIGIEQSPAGGARVLS
jgi:hypothetical protein